MSDYLELRYNADRGVWQLARSSVVVSGVIFVSGSDILGVSAPPLPLPQQLVHKSATSSFLFSTPVGSLLIRIHTNSHEQFVIK